MPIARNLPNFEICFGNVYSKMDPFQILVRNSQTRSVTFLQFCTSIWNLTYAENFTDPKVMVTDLLFPEILIRVLPLPDSIKLSRMNFEGCLNIKLRRKRTIKTFLVTSIIFIDNFRNGKAEKVLFNCYKYSHEKNSSKLWPLGGSLVTIIEK